MSALRTLARTVTMTVRATRGLTGAVSGLGQFGVRQLRTVRQRGAGGSGGMARLLDLHAASCAGDTLIAIGLAGTIFFTVPAGEARSRVALYLLVTMLPFTLLAPVVGPVLDRFQHGRRYALATTMLGRAFLAYMISEHVGGLAMYPAAFGVLVLSRAYGVARSAAVPRLLPVGLGLSEANARASLYGTVAGGVVAALGVGAATFGSPWPLRLSVPVFLYGMITALRLPPRADGDPPEAIPRLLQRPGHKGAKVLSGRQVVGTIAGSATLRALYGFLTLHMAFALRSGEVPLVIGIWTLPEGTAIGLVAAALGAGSLLATAIGSRLRITWPALVQAIGITLAAFATVLVTARPTMQSVLILCLITAAASGLAKLAVDSVIQESVPESVRASAFAHSETLLMVAWVAGGGLGLAPLPGRWGLVVAAVLIAAAAARAVLAVTLLRSRRGRHAAPEPAATIADQPPDPGVPTAPSTGWTSSPGWTAPPDWDSPAGAGATEGGRASGAGDGAAAPGRARPATLEQVDPGPGSDAPGEPDEPDEPKIDTPKYHLYRPTGLSSGEGTR